MAMYYVYAISSLTRKYIYVGLTDNPDIRISQQNNGYERTTRAYRPFSILTIEPFETWIAARQREKYLKTGVWKEYLKAKLSASCAGLSTDR